MAMPVWLPVWLAVVCTEDARAVLLPAAEAVGDEFGVGSRPGGAFPEGVGRRPCWADVAGVGSNADGTWLLLVPTAGRDILGLVVLAAVLAG